MKKIVYSVIIAGAVVLFNYSCENEKENNTITGDSLILSGELINHTECKVFKAADTPDTLSCISYEFDAATNKLTLHHINAGFNCCPDSLYCEVSLVEDTIIIEEFEKESLCNCNCLFDLNITLEGVDSKKYYIKIIEPYAGEQEKLFFELALGDENEGLYCVTRNLYPWGTTDYEEEIPLELSGQVTDHTDCKNFKSVTSDNDIPDTISCIDYSFDAINNELILKHINAGFNCCPESLYCEVSLVEDTITIEEFEKESLCDCLCLFDLDMKLKGVESKKYYIKIIEPYIEDGELLYFDMDLVSNTENSYCVIRNNYPWGI